MARLKWGRRIARQSHLREYIADAHETLPGAAVVTDAALLDYLRGRGLTICHPAGTFATGLGSMAAVDPHLRVHGVERLRVFNAGVMARVVSGNSNASMIMIAEKAADLIRDADIRSR